MIKAILLMLLLSGCATLFPGVYGPTYGPYGAGPYGAPVADIITRPPDFYTRSDIDAINAETMCRTNARTTLQAQRCGIRR